MTIHSPEIETKVRLVCAAFDKVRKMPAHARSKILFEISREIEKEAESFAKLICEEVFKPIKDARKEVARAIFTFRWASEEAKRIKWETFPIDSDLSGEGRIAIVKAVPKGPCIFITPFNFPLNLVAHKIAPAMAIGTSFLLKPASTAVKTANKLRNIVIKSGWPEDAFQIAICRGSKAEFLVEDERFKVFSFTGSEQVGWMLQKKAGRKHVGLELGGNAAVAILEDADIKFAASKCAWGGFYYSGQVCISVQRIYVHENIYEKFKKIFLEKVRSLKIGNPFDEETDIGPLITSNDAVKVQAWIKEAVEMGGKILMGGNRKGSIIEPTVVENVSHNSKLYCEEAFAPVVVLESFSDWKEAVQKINDSRFGLQAGIFTNNLSIVMDSFDGIETGGIIINDVPTFRFDPMPYGGVKNSGMGREGISYAMKEYSELRTIILKKGES